MVTRDTAWPQGTPCWADLGVDDPAQASEFYRALFGWTITQGPPEADGYRVCELNGRPVVGIGPKLAPDAPAAWLTYLSVDNADHTVKKITAAGGVVEMPARDVGDIGRVALARDPGGAVFGIWQARRHTGFGLANEPGAVTWNENMSRDYEANRGFYADVFDYRYDDIGDIDGFRYATLELQQPVGGIGELLKHTPAEVPAHWQIYFAVADTDKTLENVQQLGGTVLGEGAYDTPYGRVGNAADDHGAPFALLGPPPKYT